MLRRRLAGLMSLSALLPLSGPLLAQAAGNVPRLVQQLKTGDNAFVRSLGEPDKQAG